MWARRGRGRHPLVAAAGCGGRDRDDRRRARFDFRRERPCAAREAAKRGVFVGFRCELDAAIASAYFLVNEIHTRLLAGQPVEAIGEQDIGLPAANALQCVEQEWTTANRSGRLDFAQYINDFVAVAVSVVGAGRYLLCEANPVLCRLVEGRNPCVDDRSHAFAPC